MMKSRILYFFVLALISVTILGACSAPSQPASPTGSPAGDQAPNSPSATNGGAAAIRDNDKIAVEETVLLDQDGIKITLKSFSADDLFGPAFNVQIENNSDKNVTVQLRESSVNGVMVDTMFSSDVAAVMKAND